MGKGVVCHWGIYGEVSQKEKDKHHIMSLICGIKYMAEMNLQNRNRLRQRKTCGCQEGGDGEGVWGW